MQHYNNNYYYYYNYNLSYEPPVDRSLGGGGKRSIQRLQQLVRRTRYELQQWPLLMQLLLFVLWLNAKFWQLVNEQVTYRRRRWHWGAKDIGCCLVWVRSRLKLWKLCPHSYNLISIKIIKIRCVVEAANFSQCFCVNLASRNECRENREKHPEHPENNEYGHKVLATRYSITNSIHHRALLIVVDLSSFLSRRFKLVYFTSLQLYSLVSSLFVLSSYRS